MLRKDLFIAHNPLHLMSDTCPLLDWGSDAGWPPPSGIRYLPSDIIFKRRNTFAKVFRYLKCTSTIKNTSSTDTGNPAYLLYI